MKADRLTYYRLDKNSSIYKLACLQECISQAKEPKATAEEVFYACISDIVENSISHGFYGNLWHLAITNMLVNHENAYSLSCEMTGDNLDNSISQIALNDFQILYDIFNIKLTDFSEYFSYSYSSILEFDAKDNKGYKFNSRIRDRIITLNASLEDAADPRSLKMLLVNFIKNLA